MIRERQYQLTVIGVLCVATLLVVGGGVVASGASETTPLTAVQETTTETEATDGVSIQNLSAPDEVRVGENFTVSAELVNENESEIGQRVSYRIEGTVVDSEFVQLSAGNATTVEFNVTSEDTSGFPTGTFTHGVFTDGAEATANLTLTSADETTPEETTPEGTTPEETTPEENVTTPEENETTPEETTPEENVTTPEETTPEENVTTPEETTPEETTPEENVTTPEETTPEETTPEETTPEENVTTPEETTPEETTPEEPDAASVTFESQTSDGTEIVVDSVTLPEGGFVVAHDTGLVQGEVVESIVGTSEFLDSGTHENVTIELDEPLNESQRLVVVTYNDSNENQEFDFVTSNRTADGPYRQPDSRQAVNDIANVTVETDEGQ